MQGDSIRLPKMNKAQIAFASATVIFLLPSAAYPQLQTSSHKIRGHRCVNFRAEPSINAAVVKCLQPGTNVQVFRIPPTGRFAWVEKEGRIWYKALVPGTKAVGWIMPDCTDIVEDSNTKACTDYGSVQRRNKTAWLGVEINSSTHWERRSETPPPYVP